MHHQQEWERKKEYLIRSLFQDLSPLSPIPEEDSSIELRPHSPLPPLVIQVVPKVNHHDETEEYYQQLDRKMKKLYRKLFYDEDISSLDDIDLYLDNDYVKNVELEKFEFDNYVKNHRVPFEDHTNITGGVKSTLLSNEDSSDCIDDYRTVTCVAEVHREGDEEDVGNKENQSPILTISLRSHTRKGIQDTADDLTDQSEENGDSSTEIINLNTASELELSNETVEVMRNQSRRDTIGSLHLVNQEDEEDENTTHNFQQSAAVDNKIELFHVSTINADVEMEESTDEPIYLPLRDSLNLETFEEHDILRHSFTKETIEENNKELHIKTKENTADFNRDIEKFSTPKSGTRTSTGTIERQSSQSYESDYETLEENTVSIDDGGDDNEQLDMKDRSDSGNNIESEASGNGIEDYSNKTSSQGTGVSDNYVETHEDNNTNQETSSDGSVVKEVSDNEDDSWRTDTEVSTVKGNISEKNGNVELESSSASYFKIATSTPKSTISDSSQLITEEDKSKSEIDEFNEAMLISSSNSYKRRMKEFPRGNKRRKVDMSVQATDEMDWGNLKNNFFVGVPKIYKLCSCKDHFCDRV